MKKLQEEPGIDLADARALFDDVSKFHLELNYYLKNKEGESIGNFVDFENAVVGTILNEQLTEAQNQTLTRFRDYKILEVSTTSSTTQIPLSRRINDEKLTLSIYLGYHQLLTIRNDCLAKQNVSWEITAKNLTQ